MEMTCYSLMSLTKSLKKPEIVMVMVTVIADVVMWPPMMMLMWMPMWKVGNQMLRIRLPLCSMFASVLN